MKCYTRLLCYDDPNRKTFQQIHPDIAQDDIPSVGYGQQVWVGPDDEDRSTWPMYYVAHVPFLKQILDPADETKQVLLVSLYLARAQDWDKFGPPEFFIDKRGESTFYTEL